MKLKRRFNAHNRLHTNSLNDILFATAFLFLIGGNARQPEYCKVNNPAGKKRYKAKQSIVISIDKNQKLFLGAKQIDINLIDTILRAEVLRQRAFIDTPSVCVEMQTRLPTMAKCSKMKCRALKELARKWVAIVK